MEHAAIDEVCRMVRSLIDNPTARLLIAIETGTDEAFLVGTSDAYLRLALAALEFVSDAQAGRARSLTVDGMTVAGTSSFGEAIEPGEVGLAGGWLATSVEEARKVVEYILWLSPPGGRDA
ncbi:MAG: hypothetical protein P4L85_09355 [Paludisphaera borealis]|uniref:hypothetical protein n=1 Tax=Paludisphaera borealis TaxID=1387353 RepID=UPI0028465B1D|nr:hypothetical protein [Paludisphaera borealis]MDR3619544.1 hypothetical protein [Paludisphaera borealis]